MLNKKKQGTTHIRIKVEMYKKLAEIGAVEGRSTVKQMEAMLEEEIREWDYHNNEEGKKTL